MVKRGHVLIVKEFPATVSVSAVRDVNMFMPVTDKAPVRMDDGTLRVTILGKRAGVNVFILVT